MNNTNTITPMNGNFYNALKTHQKEFIRMVANWWISAAGAATPPDFTFSRVTLRNIAISNGFRWAPAWIVKDKNRKKNRGYYMVPEVADYILSVMPNEKSAQDAPATSAEMEPVAV
jgi:hypothetical protein